MIWAINGKLARSERPGYPSRYVEKDVVLSKIESWKSHGIRSVICLMTSDELLYYADDGDLLDLYQASELAAHVIPVENHKEHPLDEDEMAAVWTAYQAIEKPVLIHCSAGKDRTGAAVELILEKENHF